MDAERDEAAALCTVSWVRSEDRTRERAQSLRVQAALTEGPTSVPSNYIRGSQVPITSVPWVLLLIASGNT